MNEDIYLAANDRKMSVCGRFKFIYIYKLLIMKG